jgi:hypothetical protein
MVAHATNILSSATKCFWVQMDFPGATIIVLVCYQKVRFVKLNFDPCMSAILVVTDIHVAFKIYS